jgi:hypothetical protein
MVGQHASARSNVRAAVTSAGRRRGETDIGEGTAECIGTANGPRSARIKENAGIGDLDGSFADCGRVM